VAGTRPASEIANDDFCTGRRTLSVNGRFRTGGRERQGEAIPAETDPAVTVADVLGKHDGARVGEPAGSAKFT
jgi:hypothetical protein